MQPNLSIFACEYLSGRYDLSESSKSLTERAVDYLIAAVGDKPVDSYRPSHIRAFMSWVAARGADRSVRTYRKHLSPIFTAAQGDGLLAANPCSNAKCPRITARQKQTFSMVEVELLAKNSRSPEWQAIIKLAATTGMRRGEILNLRRQDVNFNERVISVCEHPETGVSWSWRPKSINSVRLVALNDTCKDMLKALCDGRVYLCVPRRRYNKLMRIQKQGGLTERNRLCPIANWQRTWKDLQIKSGVQPRRFHDLRATHLTMLSQAGLRIEEIAKLAGHSDIRVTQAYLNVDNGAMLDRQRAAIGVAGFAPATSGPPDQHSN